MYAGQSQDVIQVPPYSATSTPSQQMYAQPQPQYQQTQYQQPQYQQPQYQQPQYQQPQYQQQYAQPQPQQQYQSPQLPQTSYIPPPQQYYAQPQQGHGAPPQPSTPQINVQSTPSAAQPNSWTWQNPNDAGQAEGSQSRSLIPGRPIETRGQAVPWKAPERSESSAQPQQAFAGPAIDLSRPLDPNAPDPVRIASDYLQNQQQGGQSPQGQPQQNHPPGVPYVLPPPGSQTAGYQGPPTPSVAATPAPPKRNNTIEVTEEILAIAKEIREHYFLLHRCQEVLKGPIRMASDSQFWVQGLPRSMTTKEIEAACQDIIRDAAARIQKLDALVEKENPQWDRRWREKLVQTLLENDGRLPNHL